MFKPTCRLISFVCLGVLATRLAAKDPRLDLSRFELVTADRIQPLELDQQQAWDEYLQRSMRLAAVEGRLLDAEVQESGSSKSTPASDAGKEFEVSKEMTQVEYLRGAEAIRLGEIIVSYQTPSGGWSKAVDYQDGPRKPGGHWTTQGGEGWHYCGTLDNRSTTEQILFLSLLAEATDQGKFAEAAAKGVSWLIDAQFPSGGWPQNYPLEPGYHESITLNDNALLHAMEVLNSVRQRRSPYGWVDSALQQRAEVAFQRGIDCLLNCQVEINGQKTVWCAQYHPITLAPESARLKEPASLSGSESADLLKFMMRELSGDGRVDRAIEAAIDWLNRHQIAGLKKIKNDRGKTDYVPDADSKEIYWARFYDLRTELPIFAGAQDGIIYSSFSEMAKNNKVSYDYFSTRPRDVLTKEYPKWKKKAGL